MTILTKPLRRQLETAIKQAREIAKDAAEEAIARIGVADAEAPPHLSETNKALRRHLRAHARTLGDTRDATGAMTTARLQDAAAYENWHRMLFGRFLVERSLLIHPDLGAAISITELRELAQDEGVADEWALAEKYAAPGLPGVFKPDDPVLGLPIAPEFLKRLRALLSSLPCEVFVADDSLGWTYQFWRSSEKDMVNAAGRKIGAAELPAVTQLFTEPYMVKFLLHNTLGAWWAGKILTTNSGLARDAVDEAQLRDACMLPNMSWDFLRFVRDDDDQPWRPAAGSFPGWPTRAAEITYCDPCCGSGHFLVEAFSIIAALRQHEEDLSAGDAAVAVLRDNLHGLEIDGRCVQIAAFNVALAAWNLAGGPVPLPSPHIAWIGAPPPMSRVEMAALAEGDVALHSALERLHDQFLQAPLLGSLLKVGARDLLDADLRERGANALEKLHDAEIERAEGAFAARGLLVASNLLGRKYVLIATNVPFLGRGKQDPGLAAHIARDYPKSKADLATAMLDRIRDMLSAGGSIAVVTPQNWLFLSGYEEFRKDVLNATILSMIVVIGEHGFESNAAAGAFTAMSIISNYLPSNNANFVGVDTKESKDPEEKSLSLRADTFQTLPQALQKSNPDSRISIRPQSTGRLLAEAAGSYIGLQNGDAPRWIQQFWEQPAPSRRWHLFQMATDKTKYFDGRDSIICWEDGNGLLQKSVGARVQGTEAWNKTGVIVRVMRDLACSLYFGEKFDQTSAVIVPNNQEDLPAIWAFCSSPEYAISVRHIDQALKVTNSTLAKVPFDRMRWQSVAATSHSQGLPEPYSDDPTQWLFHGHPAFSESGTELHVALARLSGYRWPAESDAHMRLSEAAKDRVASSRKLRSGDTDGLLALHANAKDLPLADQMRVLLSEAFREPLSLSLEQALVRAADSRLDKRDARDVTLEGWLADRAFRQHCALFRQRPFLWQIWDGMKDGFSCFLNYHRLDRATLDKLAYTLLGDWIRTAKAEGSIAKLERAEQLQQKIAKIIEGESPYDLFVRWKPLAKQPLGWEPDLDDGVRFNIRPFMMAGVLREQPKGISWNKDRGTDVPSAPWHDLGPRYGGNPGDRINEHHTTLAEKRAARGTS